MLPLKNRLKKNCLEVVLRYGNKIENRAISFKFLREGNQNKAFAFVVPIKTVKPAVSRNKIKRRGRAIVFELLSIIKENCCGVFLFKKESASMSFSDLKGAIIDLFKKAELFDLNHHDI